MNNQNGNLNNPNNGFVGNNNFQNQQPIQNGGFQNPQMNQMNMNPQMQNFNSQPSQNIGATYQAGQSLNNMPSQTNSKLPKNIVPIVIGVAAVIVVVLLFFTGGTKTLVCTNSESSYGMKMDMKATMKFKKDNINSVEAVITVDLGSYASQKDYLIELLEEEYSSYEDDGIDVSVTSDSNKVYVKMKANKDNFDEMGLATATTFKEAKKEMEEEGFTCK